MCFPIKRARNAWRWHAGRLDLQLKNGKVEPFRAVALTSLGGTCDIVSYGDVQMSD
jgi:hypothetical protein